MVDYDARLIVAHLDPKYATLIRFLSGNIKISDELTETHGTTRSIARTYFAPGFAGIQRYFSRSYRYSVRFHHGHLFIVLTIQSIFRPRLSTACHPRFRSKLPAVAGGSVDGSPADPANDWRGNNHCRSARRICLWNLPSLRTGARVAAKGPHKL